MSALFFFCTAKCFNYIIDHAISSSLQHWKCLFKKKKQNNQMERGQFSEKFENMTLLVVWANLERWILLFPTANFKVIVTDLGQLFGSDAPVLVPL